MGVFDWLFGAPRTTLNELNRHREVEDRLALERLKEASRHREAMQKMQPRNAWRIETRTYRNSQPSDLNLGSQQTAGANHSVPTSGPLKEDQNDHAS